jgi:hypothetical protein
LPPFFDQAEPKRQAMDYLHRLVSPAGRKNGWPLAEVGGDTTSYGVQQQLRRA